MSDRLSEDEKHKIREAFKNDVEEGKYGSPLTAHEALKVLKKEERIPKTQFQSTQQHIDRVFSNFFMKEIEILKTAVCNEILELLKHKGLIMPPDTELRSARLERTRWTEDEIRVLTMTDEEFMLKMKSNAIFESLSHALTDFDFSTFPAETCTAVIHDEPKIRQSTAEFLCVVVRADWTSVARVCILKPYTWTEDGETTFAWSDDRPEIMHDHWFNSVNDENERVIAWKKLG